MTVADRVPSRKAFICATMWSFGNPASDTTSAVTLRPCVPWQLAQLAARLRATAVSWACAAAATSASAAATSLTVMGPPRGEAYCRPLKKQRPREAAFCGSSDRASGDRGCLLFEGELDLLALADVDAHLAAVLQPPEQQLIGERTTDVVLDEPRHRPRAHQRVEAFLRQVLLEGIGERRLDLLFRELLVELHQKLLDHPHDGVLVE